MPDASPQADMILAPLYCFTFPCSHLAVLFTGMFEHYQRTTAAAIQISSRWLQHTPVTLTWLPTEPWMSKSFVFISYSFWHRLFQAEVPKCKDTCSLYVPALLGCCDAQCVINARRFGTAWWLTTVRFYGGIRRVHCAGTEDRLQKRPVAVGSTQSLIHRQRR
jgi:hypothetical protein